MRKFIIVFLLGFILSPSAIFSAGLDQRCWQRAACEAARIRIIGSDSEAKDGFVSAEEDSSVAQACPNKVLDDTGTASGKDVGFCLPVGQTVTRISFGGTNKFLNIGEFIKFMYRYSMWAATILAVMLVIISGVQWTASGGNSDMIGSAKKRIAGAVSGLILLAFAYTVLNTINPFLVNLRLPQSWLINEQGMAPPFCAQLKGAKMLAFYRKYDEIISDEVHNLRINEAEASNYKIPSNIEVQPDSPNGINARALPACGFDYFVQDTGGLFCRGNLCGKNTVCSPITYGKNKKNADDFLPAPICKKGGLGIKLQMDSIFQTGGAIFDSTLINTFLHTQARHPNWLDEGDGAGSNMALYYGCSGIGQVFPKYFDNWNIKENWFQGWYRLDPKKDNSLENSAFSQYILYYNPGGKIWGTEQLDSLNHFICPEGKKPYGVWVKIEIELKSESFDAFLFIGATPDGKAI
ncbi:MAG: hypothetical protein AAB390_05130, partial [Patescibacteria group bacterium]